MTNEIRYATRDDIVSWYGRVPGTMRAILLSINGEPAAIGGMMRQNGRNVAFMDMRSEASNAPFSIWRGSLKAMREIINQSPLPVYARVSDELPTANAFLRRLGFIPIDEKEEVMVWQAQQWEFRQEETF